MIAAIAIVPNRSSKPQADNLKRVFTGFNSRVCAGSRMSREPRPECCVEMDGGKKCDRRQQVVFVRTSQTIHKPTRQGMEDGLVDCGRWDEKRRENVALLAGFGALVERRARSTEADKGRREIRGEISGWGGVGLGWIETSRLRHAEHLTHKIYRDAAIVFPFMSRRAAKD